MGPMLAPGTLLSGYIYSCGNTPYVGTIYTVVTSGRPTALVECHSMIRLAKCTVLLSGIKYMLRCSIKNILSISNSTKDLTTILYWRSISRYHTFCCHWIGIYFLQEPAQNPAARSSYVIVCCPPAWWVCCPGNFVAWARVLIHTGMYQDVATQKSKMLVS